MIMCKDCLCQHVIKSQTNYTGILNLVNIVVLLSRMLLVERTVHEHVFAQTSLQNQEGKKTCSAVFNFILNSSPFPWRIAVILF